MHIIFFHFFLAYIKRALYICNNKTEKNDMKNLLTFLILAVLALTSCDNYNNREAYYDLTNVQDNKDFVMNVVLPSSYNVGDTVSFYGQSYVITHKIECNTCSFRVNNNKNLRNK